MKTIPLIRPWITQEVKDAVIRVLDSGMLTEGTATAEFESLVRAHIGCGHAIAVTSCTTGLEIGLRCLGIGEGDEVIIPDFTYPATADAVLLAGATAVIVDVHPETMLIDYNAVEKAITPQTKAIMPVSLFGNPLDYDRLTTLAQRHGIHIIEDAACALGAEYKGKKVGGHGHMAVFSFHPRKFITTGEGGIIATANDRHAAWIQEYKHFGMPAISRGATACFDTVGTNSKMSNLLAAVGAAQMRHIHGLLDRRREQSAAYFELLRGHQNVVLPKATETGRHSYQTFCVLVDRRDEIIGNMREQGIETQIGTYALHHLSAFRDTSRVRLCGPTDASDRLFKNCLALPLYHDLTIEQQRIVIQSLINSMGN